MNNDTTKEKLVIQIFETKDIIKQEMKAQSEVALLQ